eukprot:CAMPEP_0202980374 /NCGR_PEP_ID=MMETSP1396-20130829/86314_1 /ASSEMBLY_ACC=CAM_ASM_000872 /TAXON_ID= /ORGANISM="Pseudokeronopsis sp., Strain Brazil" /LENGTH=120 /DNA_ID=CAMNT_0049720319 /DNA_START=919 /DNA_END=1281 /DNA_ORIENTATION=+
MNETNLASSLEYVIRNYKSDKINRTLLRQLVNFEEADFIEQLILLDNVRAKEGHLQDQSQNESSSEEVSGFREQLLIEDPLSDLNVERHEQEDTVSKGSRTHGQIPDERHEITDRNRHLG